jgi:hypothetical protein
MTSLAISWTQVNMAWKVSGGELLDGELGDCTLARLPRLLRCALLMRSVEKSLGALGRSRTLYELVRFGSMFFSRNSSSESCSP